MAWWTAEIAAAVHTHMHYGSGPMLAVLVLAANVNAIFTPVPIMLTHVLSAQYACCEQ